MAETEPRKPTARFRDAVLALDERGRERLLASLQDVRTTADPFFSQVVERAQELHRQGATLAQICRLFAEAGITVTAKTVRKYVAVAGPRSPAGGLVPSAKAGGGESAPGSAVLARRRFVESNNRGGHAAQKVPREL